MTALVMATAVQRAGLVMVLQTVKIRPMAVISPAMIMMVVTVKVVLMAELMAELMVVAIVMLVM